MLFTGNTLISKAHMEFCFRLFRVTGTGYTLLPEKTFKKLRKIYETIVFRHYTMSRAELWSLRKSKQCKWALNNKCTNLLTVSGL